MAGQFISTVTAIWFLHIVYLLSIADVSYAQSPGKYIPDILNYTALDNRILYENLTIGTYLGRITAVDRDGTKVTYAIRDNGGEYFQIDTNTGDVTLKKLLDFETEIEIKSIIVVTDQNGQSNSRDCKVFVNDVNDNSPLFTDTAIFRNISETEKPGFFVTPITVNDLDTVNAQLTVTCAEDTALFLDACDKFNVMVTESNNKFWRGYLVLSRTLDYETRKAYNIRLIASDGDPRHDVSNEVHVEVVDVNDTPPTWGYAGPKNIPEEEPVATPVQQVYAQDGDVTNPRQIRYELFGPNTDAFQINSFTGLISNAKRLDYDSAEHEKGVPYDVYVRAREVINNATGQLGNDSTTTATLALKITVEDINDNGPVFFQNNYVAYVDENIVSGANIPGLQMTVTDIDSGTFNSFDLVTLNNTDVFGIVPSNDAASSSATLFVLDGSKIDYELGPKQYIINVRAIQNFVNKNMFTGSATVTIYVQDINDMSPAFDSSSYYRTVSETALPGTVIIHLSATDVEEGNFGTAGIRYRLYGDNTPPHFQIDEITGVLTVAPCNSPNQPGLTPCIDYERKRDYTLTVSATDNLGKGRTRSVQVFITVLDENDNQPRIDTNYVRYINEDQMVTINPLLIEPVDPDTVGGPLTFTIRADASGLWKITSQTDSTTGRQSGNITATRPIKYRDAAGGEFNFAVTVADQKYSTVASVKIIVIDINDNTPQFIPRSFDIAIPETTKGDVFVIKVTATDADAPTTGNGIIDFSIQSGAQGKFTITNVTLVGNEFVADIYTSRDAVFNFETQNIYSMLLIAKDRGSPQSLSGTANLTVRILDDNNKDPRIQPSFQSVNVYENEPVGKVVYLVTATDPDVNNRLQYYMTAIQATDGAGDNVSSSAYDFTKLFRLEETTGNVIVSAPLDRDKASRITYDLVVRDINANPIQTGKGTLLIHILEFNDKAPWFDFPLYNITIDEEMNINSFILNLNCQDADDKIAGYTITQTNPRRPTFFSLLPGSGAMIVSDRIDYEQIEVIELMGQCTDAGQPQLSNITRIIVNIRNINDNSPVFSQNLYRTSILENTKGGTLNITVSASDMDKGDFGVVRYQLNDPYGFFAIDNITGVITILPNAVFDREKAAFLGFQVIAYDSPLNETVRRRSTVPVYITILDVNDNCPVFSRLSYEGKVPESANIDTDIIDILVTDKDDGINGQFVFAVKVGSGSPPEAESLFGINSGSGRVYVKGNLKGKIRSYNLNITATDMNGQNPLLQCTSEVPIEIEVQQSDNNAPEWIKPPNRNSVIYVLESQYDGMLVYGAKAIDNDVGPNGVIDYYFSVTGSLVSSTAEFRINRVTGVIRSEVVFDRELRDNYFLTLMAKDRGNPASSSETTIIIIILDVNDNEPMFPMKDGVVIPLELQVKPEDIQLPPSGMGYRLGSCKATDADTDVLNNRIFYELSAASSGVRDYIIVTRDTCDIYLVKPISYETMQTLQFEILAYNEKNDDTVKRAKREVNPSIQPVIVGIQDVNDNSPIFTKSNYLACVSVTAAFQQNIVQVTATDKDVFDNGRLNYSISNNNEFGIDKNHIIYNKISFRDGKMVYQFNAMATDSVNSATAAVTILVTSPSNNIRLKVNRPLNDVLPFKQQLVNTLVDSSNGAITYACVDDMTNHVDDNGQESLLATDVLMSAFKYENGQYVAYSAADLVNYVNTEKQKANSAFNAIYVTDAQEEGKRDSFILKEDAVLAVLIISILLLFLALLLLIICCICIRNSDRKKKKNIKAASHTIVHVHEPLETSVNPVYNVRVPESVEDSAVYSTVKKVHLTPTPISPIVVPAPYEDDEFIPVEPPRAYLEEPEPVIETYIEPEPVIDTYFEPEPVIDTYIEPESVIDTYFEPEPVIETEILREVAPERVHESPRHFEPEFEDRLDTIMDDHSEPEMVRHVSFPDPMEDNEIETSIRDSPPPSPPSSIAHDAPDYDSD